MESLPDLPPRVPEELPELDRALQLLGAVCQAGKIKDKHRIELETLLGCRVTQQLAAHWKTRRPLPRAGSVHEAVTQGYAARERPVEQARG